MNVLLILLVTDYVKVILLSAFIRYTQVKETSRVTVHPLTSKFLQGYLNIFIFKSVNNSSLFSLFTNNNLWHRIIKNVIVLTMQPGINTIRESVRKSNRKSSTISFNHNKHFLSESIDNLFVLSDGVMPIKDLLEFVALSDLFINFVSLFIHVREPPVSQSAYR